MKVLSQYLMFVVEQRSIVLWMMEVILRLVCVSHPINNISSRGKWNLTCKFRIRHRHFQSKEWYCQCVFVWWCDETKRTKTNQISEEFNNTDTKFEDELYFGITRNEFLSFIPSCSIGKTRTDPKEILFSLHKGSHANINSLWKFSGISRQKSANCQWVWLFSEQWISDIG